METAGAEPEVTQKRAPHISVSALKMYERCPQQYAFRYVDGLRIPPGVAQIKGRAFHGGIAHNFRQKVQSRTDLPLDVVKDATAEAVDTEFAGEVFLNPDEKSVGLATLRGTTKDAAVKMVGVHHEKIAPAIQPALVEQKITLKPDPGKFPMNIMGILDLADENDVIRDNKTASKSPNAEAAARSQQLTTYALLFRAFTGRRETGVALDTVVMTEAGNLSVKVQESKRDWTDIQALKRRLEVTVAAIKTGIFPPTDPEAWWCSEKWCGYWDDVCPFGRKAGGAR
jgi:RecB family exonuclease